MILESVHLQVKDGQAEAFEAAFNEASAIIRTVDGYINHTLHRCLEEDHLYLLLVEWETLEAHTQGFRGSAQYQQWKTLLHQFYEPFPQVYHFNKVYGE